MVIELPLMVTVRGEATVTRPAARKPKTRRPAKPTARRGDWFETTVVKKARES